MTCVTASIALAAHQRWGRTLARVGLIIQIFAAGLVSLLVLDYFVLGLDVIGVGIRGRLPVIGFFVMASAITGIGWHLLRSVSRPRPGGG